MGYACQLLYCVTIYAAKMGVLVQIKDIFTGKNKVRNLVYWTSWVMMILVTCVYTASLFIDIFQCVPVQKAWRPSTPGRCGLDGIGGIVNGVINLVSGKSDPGESIANIH